LHHKKYKNAKSQRQAVICHKIAALSLLSETDELNPEVADSNPLKSNVMHGG
jgi:hypothetical protein